MTVSLPDPVSYVPYKEVGSQRNIVVDGAPLASTVLTLSHWPNNRTPEALKRDTSTATVFAYLDSPNEHQHVEIATNNHFDEDGLFGMFALSQPASALRFRDLLIGGAMAGDFGVFENRDAVRLCFTIEALTDKRISPLPKAAFTGCEHQRVSTLYRRMLDLLPEILENVEEYRRYWHEQDAHLQESESLIADGEVEIEDVPESDLAIVRIPGALPALNIRRYLQSERASVHPFAIHNATDGNRIIRIQDGCYEFQYRYESWVQVVSRRPMFRVDLGGLAARLNSLETAAGTWRADKVTEIVPRLFLEGIDRSSIAEETFVGEVIDHLSRQSVAWDPYNWELP
jgi:hypothetical protein